MRTRNSMSILFVLLAVAFFLLPTFANAADQQGNFSLQVTPSPLVVSIQPGTSKTSELKIRNTGDKKEQLKIETKSFTINGESGEITLGDTSPSDISKWVSFSAPTFTINPGEWFTERVTISLPANAGFSYSFALSISRVDTVKANEGETTIKGSVAVFTLISVDRPDAKKELQVVSFSTTNTVYEYLPATIKTTLKNTGNTIVQPAGNIFIQRGNKAEKPITTLPLNEGRGYILPASSRTLTTEWKDGFPVYTLTQSSDNTAPKKTLSWDWSQISKFRIGPYTAKLVAIYNDGTRDIPLEAETTFWVFPWKIVIGGLLIAAVLLLGIATLIKKAISIIHHPVKDKDTHEDKNKE